MLSASGRKLASKALTPLTKVILSTHITPNTLTLTGFGFAIISSYFYATGKFVYAGVFLLISGLFDLLDGEIAKVGGKATNFGAFLDSIIDRYSDTFVLTGIIYYFASRIENNPEYLFYTALGCIAMIGFFMVSYTKARAENFIENCKVGSMQRGERLIILIICSFIGQIKIALWILAITTHITAFQRIHHTWKETHHN